MIVKDWSQFRYFQKHEFDCKHTGQNKMLVDMVQVLDEMRHILQRPLVPVSGYRDNTHPLEASKDQPGEHFYGAAVDIACRSGQFAEVTRVAYDLGIRRFGWAPHKGFIHLGTGDRNHGFPQAEWTYD